jgi:hypothetical protein
MLLLVLYPVLDILFVRLTPSGDLLRGDTNNDGPWEGKPFDIIGFLLKFTLFGDIDIRLGK